MIVQVLIKRGGPPQNLTISEAQADHTKPYK